MTQITIADIVKLRKLTAAGIADCKNALTEANGDFEKAIEIIRKKGQLVANKRADREASEGCVIAKINSDFKSGVMVVLNCETDFVAKNQNFIDFTTNIAELALDKFPENLEHLKQLKIENRTVFEHLTDKIGTIGEKIELCQYEKIKSSYVISYIHPGNKLASLVGFNKTNVDLQTAKDIAMQVAAMNPVAIDKGDVPQTLIEKELEIGKEQARLEGKPENMLDKIALGKLNKFYKDCTLLNQEFIKNNKLTVRDYIKSADKELEITSFRRISLNL
ncbi:MAG: elongation factor Ts [Bacteroidia bacterium]|nr:elongation factor Ts [Bacteroidia bacterium]